MNLSNLLIFFHAIFLIHCFSPHNKNELLSRKRRYLVFPEGSGFYAVFCLTSLMDISGTDLFTQNINWGVDYELPNDTKPFMDVYKPATKRRNRRQLYSGIETILTSMGYNGRSCVLRTLCEAQQHFTSKENSLVFHILSLIFKFPREKLLPNEPEIHRIYHYATEIGRSREIRENSQGTLEKCSELFPCPFLLTDLILGLYNTNSGFEN